MAYELPIPDFLKEDEETIHQRMLEKAPPGIDVSEGSFFWDATRPVALEKAEMIEFKLVETLKVCFPQWAYGQYLDLHAEMVGLQRRPAVPASGYVTVTGQPGASMLAGTELATPAVGDQLSIIFRTKEPLYLDESGVGTVAIEAATPGTIGNVAANTITLMVQPLSGITSITNPEPTSGGTEEEDDESLRARILEARKLVPLSGSITDYKIWAKEVAGVGEAYVIPEWQGPGTGTVKVIIVDSNGQPANAALIEAVQNYIAPADGSGKAPIGAIVTVAAPTAHVLNYEFTLQLKEGYGETEVINAIKSALAEYYKTVGVGGEIRYNKVAAIIMETEGVEDFSGLTINGGTSNIQLASDEYPVTGTVNGV